jgi:hypothetical protein
MTDMRGEIREPVQRNPSGDSLPPRHDSILMESASFNTAFARAESCAPAALESATVNARRVLLIASPHPLLLD